MFLLSKDYRDARRGFTLIEILVVMGMIGILAATVLVAVNPLKQFAQARNTQRISNVNAILNAVGNRIADNEGLFTSGSCSQAIPSDQPKEVSNGTDGLDLRQCLVPEYIPELPYDPSTGANDCTTDDCAGSSYHTGYTIQLLGSNRVQVCAPGSVQDGMSQPYCLTR